MTPTEFSGMRLLSKNKLLELCTERQRLKYIKKSSSRQVGVRDVCLKMLSFQNSIKEHSQEFPLGQNKKTFFVHSETTPDIQNLKKLSIPTALVYMYNNADRSRTNKSTIKKIKSECIEIFENLTYCAYKFKLFETALARPGDFDTSLEALEFSSNISFIS